MGIIFDGKVLKVPDLSYVPRRAQNLLWRLLCKARAPITITDHTGKQITGIWTTMRGAKVFIKTDGTVGMGPANLIGQTHASLKGQARKDRKAARKAKAAAGGTTPATPSTTTSTPAAPAGGTAATAAAKAAAQKAAAKARRDKRKAAKKAAAAAQAPPAAPATPAAPANKPTGAPATAPMAAGTSAAPASKKSRKKRDKTPDIAKPKEFPTTSHTPTVNQHRPSSFKQDEAKLAHLSPENQEKCKRIGMVGTDPAADKYILDYLYPRFDTGVKELASEEYKKLSRDITAGIIKWSAQQLSNALPFFKSSKENIDAVIRLGIIENQNFFRHKSKAGRFSELDDTFKLISSVPGFDKTTLEDYSKCLENLKSHVYDNLINPDARDRFDTLNGFDNALSEIRWGELTRRMTRSQAQIHDGSATCKTRFKVDLKVSDEAILDYKDAFDQYAKRNPEVVRLGLNQGDWKVNDGDDRVGDAAQKLCQENGSGPAATNGETNAHKKLRSFLQKLRSVEYAAKQYRESLQDKKKVDELKPYIEALENPGFDDINSNLEYMLDTNQHLRDYSKVPQATLDKYIKPLPPQQINEIQNDPDRDSVKHKFAARFQSIMPSEDNPDADPDELHQQIYQELEKRKQFLKDYKITEHELAKPGPLKCQLSSVSPELDKVIRDGVLADWDNDTHGGMKPEILGVYEIKGSTGRDEDFEKLKADTGQESHILYHGTGPFATALILGKSGEFKAGGGMLNSGLYLADKSSKSAQYMIDGGFSRHGLSGSLIISEALLGTRTPDKEGVGDTVEAITKKNGGKWALYNNEWAVRKPEKNVIPRYLVSAKVR